MEYYDISVQCTMISLGGNDAAEWAKRKDVEAVIAERDALRAELARVKAESLHVVVDGEACDWEMLEDSDKDGLFVVDAQLCCRERCTMNKVVNVSTGAVSHIYDEDGVQPVRLKRWEDE